MLLATSDDWLAFLLAMYFIAGMVFFLSGALNSLLALRHLKPPKEWWSRSFTSNSENYTDAGKVYLDRAKKHGICILFWLLSGFFVIGFLKFMNFRG